MKIRPLFKKSTSRLNKKTHRFTVFCSNSSTAATAMAAGSERDREQRLQPNIPLYIQRVCYRLVLWNAVVAVLVCLFPACCRRHRFGFLHCSTKCVLCYHILVLPGFFTCRVFFFLFFLQWVQHGIASASEPRWWWATKQRSGGNIVVWWSNNNSTRHSFMWMNESYCLPMLLGCFECAVSVYACCGCIECVYAQ